MKISMVPRQCPQIRTILLGFALFVGTVFLYKFGPDYESLRTLKEAWNIGHIAFFALVVYAASLTVNRAQSLIVDILLVVGICFVLGALIEWSQDFFGRDSSWHDVFKDVLGGILAVLFLLPSRKTLSKPFLNRVRVVFLIVLALACVPLGKAVYDDYAMVQQFPILSDLENPYEDKRWSSGRLEHQIIRYGNHSLHVKFSAKKRRSTRLKYYPADWRGYATVNFSVYNSSTSLFRLNFRIYDKTYVDQHRPTDDRFVVRLELQPGWNDIVMKLDTIRDSLSTRAMDLSQIRGITFYADRSFLSTVGPTDLYFDHFYLGR